MLNNALSQTIYRIISDWPQKPKESAQKLLDFYGEPDEYSPSQLIWHHTDDGWKRSILYKEEIPHGFPAYHTDFLEQSINYRVPIEMFSKLAEFDGSVVAERTKGELTSRSGETAMNFVALNLAHDIIIGDKTVKEARDEYTYLYKVFQDGKVLPYAKTFQFEIPPDSTADPDLP